jgi:hypothetical protein
MHSSMVRDELTRIAARQRLLQEAQLSDPRLMLSTAGTVVLPASSTETC